jgi:hypothetical protein
MRVSPRQVRESIPHVLVGGRSFHDREEVVALRNAVTAMGIEPVEVQVVEGGADRPGGRRFGTFFHAMLAVMTCGR